MLRFLLYSTLCIALVFGACEDLLAGVKNPPRIIFTAGDDDGAPVTEFDNGNLQLVVRYKTLVARAGATFHMVDMSDATGATVCDDADAALTLGTSFDGKRPF